MMGNEKGGKAARINADEWRNKHEALRKQSNWEFPGVQERRFNPAGQGRVSPSCLC